VVSERLLRLLPEASRVAAIGAEAGVAAVARAVRPRLLPAVIKVAEAAAVGKALRPLAASAAGAEAAATAVVEEQVAVDTALHRQALRLTAAAAIKHAISLDMRLHWGTARHAPTLSSLDFQLSTCIRLLPSAIFM